MTRTRRWLPLLLAALAPAHLHAQSHAAHAPANAHAHASGPVVVLSLDGLSDHGWRTERAPRELVSLRRIAAAGVVARGTLTAFPSVTPAGHASLWTGTYGRDNGITAGSTPVLPRAGHTFLERISGFDARALRAEPIWVSAARAGVRVVVHQGTQSHPFIPFVTAPDAPEPPVLATGYGPPMLAPQAVIRGADLQATDPAAWGAALPRSALPPRTVRWSTGGVELHGALVAEGKGVAGYTAIWVAQRPGGPAVRVAAVPTETVPPHGRELARFFSDGLSLEVGAARTPTVAYFRLWELAPDGSELLLFRSPLHELALHRAGTDTRAAARRILEEAGGFIGNGPSYAYRDGLLGTPIPAGGDGTAERRYLEGLELVIRQHDRLSRWLAAEYDPDLLIDYSPYPDELDHTWYGFVRPDVTGADSTLAAAFEPLRAWGYAALDRRVALLDSIAGPDGHFIVVSDHGMAPVARSVRVDAVLRHAGLLALDTAGAIDPARSRAAHLSHCVMVNTTEWKGGIVAPAARDSVVRAARAALAAVRDPGTGDAIFAGFFRPEQFADSLGIGGPAGCDLYFDLASGWAPAGGGGGEGGG